MANLMSMSRGRFKSKSRKSTSRTMAKRTRKSKSKRGRSSGGTSGVFSGKILGFKIPLVGDALRNKSVQKVIAGAGIVSIALTIASLVNNPTVNRALGNKFVRLGLAGAAGDVTGIAAQFVKEGGVGQLRGIAGGNGGAQQQASLVSVPGGGVA